jgi:hypothetical protein
LVAAIFLGLGLDFDRIVSGGDHGASGAPAVRFSRLACLGWAAR